MLLAIQILLGVLFAGTGIGLDCRFRQEHEWMNLKRFYRETGHLLLLLVSLLTFLTL